MAYIKRADRRKNQYQKVSFDFKLSIAAVSSVLNKSTYPAGRRCVFLTNGQSVNQKEFCEE